MARDLARTAMALTLGALVPTLGACSLDTAGVGSDSGAKPGGEDDDEGDEDAGTDAEGDTAGGGGGTGASGATASPVDETAEGGVSDLHPEVNISHGPVFDFGPRNLTDNVDQAFTVTNEGDAEATAVQVSGVGGAFSIMANDCPETLAPGATCQVQVRFDPDLFGDVQTELQVAFQDQGMATSASRPIVGRGVGVSGNLLVNGGGELGNATDIPPMGWTIAYGPSWSANWFEEGLTPVEGSRTISAGWGPPGVNQFTLHQQMDVAALTTWGDAEGVRFYFRAFHRSETEGNDPTWVVLRFRSSGGVELGASPSSMFSGTTWNESVGNSLAPADTHHVQLVLECTRVLNDSCSGFYDGMEVWAEWLG